MIQTVHLRESHRETYRSWQSSGQGRRDNSGEELGHVN